MNRYAIALAAVSTLGTFALAATPPAGSSSAFKFTPTPPPVAAPSVVPSVAPSNAPVAAPANAPSVGPSNAPVAAPSNVPSVGPSSAPVAAPSNVPAVAPSNAPVAAPSAAPAPSNAPMAGNAALTAPANPSAADASDTLLDLPNAKGQVQNRGIQATPADQAIPAGSTLDSNDTMLNNLPNLPAAGTANSQGSPTIVAPGTPDHIGGGGLRRNIDPTLPPQRVQPLGPNPMPSRSGGAMNGKAGK